MDLQTVKKHTITVVNNNERLLCREDRDIMTGLVSVGMKAVPKGCHGGGCGVCRVQIISGETRKSVMSKKYVSAEDHANGIGLACRLFPLSDITLRFIGKPSD